MLLVFNIKDPKSKDWAGFWKMTIDKPETPIERFGFKMCVLDVRKDATRIATECATRMRWATATLRAEDYATMRKNYQAVRDCKSHRAIGSAERYTDRIIDLAEQMTKEIMDCL